MQEAIDKAAESGDLSELRCILADENGNIDVNCGADDGHSPLYLACCWESPAIVSLLLAHPLIDVNRTSRHGTTPLMIACCRERVDIVRLLLDDPRVRADLLGFKDATALWHAADNESEAVVKLLIASGKELAANVGAVHHVGAFSRTEILCTPLALARYRDFESIARLLDWFRRDPDDCRLAVRLELGLTAAPVASLFALVIFLCDDFLRLQENRDRCDRCRFFMIAVRMPIEIQMILCHRVFGASRDIVLTKYSEPAFASLAASLSSDLAPPDFHIRA